MRQKLIAAFAAMLIILLFPLSVSAAVNTVSEPTDKDRIYIAGNPDMYPFEYYDKDSKTYKGILPELYQKISEESGTEFSYVSAGSGNEQKRMAENKQVEIVSAHNEGDIEDLKKEILIDEILKKHLEIITMTMNT